MIEFISDLNQLIEIIRSVLRYEGSSEILISGTFDNGLYKYLIDELIVNNCIQYCKVIIPYISGSGIISRTNINRMINSGGQLRINSKHKNNVLIIGKHAFAVSFSFKHSKEHGVSSNFESCIVTDNCDVVKKIQNSFANVWEESLTLVNEL